jgi:hypothetical protein
MTTIHCVVVSGFFLQHDSPLSGQNEQLWFFILKYEIAVRSPSVRARHLLITGRKEVSNVWRKRVMTGRGTVAGNGTYFATLQMVRPFLVG